ncbi:MAG TPA: hypothetical protein VMW53_12645, partial [archaeon]|nr:hypothetical protein [archaeon]
APAKRLAWTSSAPDIAFSHHVCLQVSMQLYRMAYMINLAMLFFGNAYEDYVVMGSNAVHRALAQGWLQADRR